MPSRPRSVTTRRLAVAFVATALGVVPILATSPAAHAAGTGAGSKITPITRTVNSDLRMTRALTSRATTAKFGTAFTGAVIDVESGKAIWS